MARYRATRDLHHINPASTLREFRAGKGATVELDSDNEDVRFLVETGRLVPADAETGKPSSADTAKAKPSKKGDADAETGKTN